jgi:hypothetical protein
MPRPARPWFRFYVEAVGDRKLRRLTPAQRWIWTAILAAARESPIAGQLYVAEGLPMTHAELADYAGVKEREILPVIEAMTAMSSLATTDEGVVIVLNFNNRQYESDNVTKRTRTHRERSKERSKDVPTERDESTPDRETAEESAKTYRLPVSIREISADLSGAESKAQNGHNPREVRGSADEGTFPKRSRNGGGNAPETETETDKEKTFLPHKRGTRIPKDWKPSTEDVAWQRESGISDLLARRELPKFCDYWVAKTRDATKLDWSATWRNWLRTAVEREPKTSTRTEGGGW